ncbi:SEC-C domain-containing protein [Halobacillus mangrovi]|uniref:SEC-C domain-containing protein n=1 Tax=Halobacillus mangrovi TaxID=402384 RepID=UPI003D963C4D
MFITKKEAKRYTFEPYEKCPCESGKKYKFCCFEKSKSFPKNEKEKHHPKRIKAEANKIFNGTDFKTCFGFDTKECKGGIIGAHSLQNNGVLDKIATDNHVYKLSVEMTEQSPILEFEKKGKKQASRFNGFCKYHDEVYFSNIEDIVYTGTDEQNFWYAFRAFSFEYHRKKRLGNHFPKLFAKFPYATRLPYIQMNYRTCQLDLRDKAREYERFKQTYLSGSYSELESFTKVLPYRVGFTGTTAVAVKWDISGNEALDIFDYKKETFISALYISVIPREYTTLIIVSRFKEDECYKQVIEKLHSNSDVDLLFSYLTFCLAEYSENVYFSPEVIDNLPKDAKKNILSAFQSSIIPDYELRLESYIRGFQVNLFHYRLSVE